MCNSLKFLELEDIFDAQFNGYMNFNLNKRNIKK